MNPPDQPGSGQQTIYKDADYTYHSEAGWISPPTLLDEPLDQTLTVGVDIDLSGTGPWGPDGLIKHTVAHPQVGLRAAFSLKAARVFVNPADQSQGYYLTEKDFMVSLEDTHATPRPGTVDPASLDSATETDWYIDRVDVEMGFVAEPPGVDLYSVAPPTGSLSGTVSSSISRTLTAGFFGDSLTGSYSQTWGNSFSYSLQDFATTDNSSNTRSLQTLRLQVSEGAAYNQPSDLVDGEPYEWATALDSTFYQLPNKAISRVDLACQGLWVVPGEFKETVTFQIKITPHFVHQWLRQKMPFEMTADELQRWEDNLATPLGPFGKLSMLFFDDIDVQPMPLVWSFDVDFSSVGPVKKTP